MSPRSQVFRLLLLGVVTTALTSRPALAVTYVYVSLMGDKQIVTLAMNEQTGRLQRQSVLDLEGEPGALTTDPHRRFLFASIRSEGKLASFRIDPASGALSPVSVVTAGADPAYVATDKTGKYLLSAYYRAGKVVVHEIGGDGRIRSEPVASIPTAEKAHAIETDPTNRYALVPHTGPNRIYRFRFDERTGQLSPRNPLQFTKTGDNTGPRHVAFHPQTSMVYFDNEQGNSVTQYYFHRDSGDLTPVATLSTLPADFQQPNSCARLELHPNGRFLYAANRGHDSLARYRLNPETGAMTFQGNTPTEATPRSFTIEPGGQFLYAAGQSSDQLAAFRIHPRTGDLERFATYPIGSKPWWVQAVTMPDQRE